MKKITIMTDVKVTADIRVPSYYRDPKDVERYLRDWVKEFHEFIRDHRSQDPVNLNVEPEYQDVCSSCERDFETYEENGKLFCNHCGEEFVNEVVSEAVK